MASPRLWNRSACLVGLCSLLAFAAPPPSFGQKAKRLGAQGEMPATRELFATETIPFSAPAPTFLVPGMKCDLKGDIYLLYSGLPLQTVLPNLPYANALLTLPIQELSLESKTAIPYPVPSIPDYETVGRLDFDVDGRGKAYALLAADNQPKPGQNLDSDFYIVRYKDDGTTDSLVKISNIPGRHLIPQKFAAFPDGNFLVTGTTQDSPQEIGTFTAVFSRSGAFVANVELLEEVKPAPLAAAAGSTTKSAADGAGRDQAAGGQREGGSHASSGRGQRVNISPSAETMGGGLAISAPDGNIYLLRATSPPRLYAVSSGGQVVREFEIPLAAAGSPIQFGTAGIDKLFIQFAHVGTPGDEKSGKQIMVLDPYTGEVSAVYRLAPTESSFSFAACAISPYQFLFVGISKDNKLQLVRYSP